MKHEFSELRCSIRGTLSATRCGHIFVAVAIWAIPGSIAS